MRQLSVIELMELFGTDEIAEDWFITARWPNGLQCAYCKGDRVAERGNHPTQRFHCLDCMRFYSVKTNSVMHSSKLGYRKWAVAIYMFVTHPKGVSSYQLHRNLGITQKTAWHLAHRIRKALDTDLGLFNGPVEVDETFMGGRARNQPFERKIRLSKVPVIGMKDRATGMVKAKPIASRNGYLMRGFVYDNTDVDAEVHTDEASGYRTMYERKHFPINHSAGEYGPTNGIEAFWSLIKRAHMGVYHKMSPKHLHRYITEFQERHNRRPLNTVEMMQSVVSDGADKRLRYEDLIAGGSPYEPKPNGTEEQVKVTVDWAALKGVKANLSELA